MTQTEFYELAPRCVSDDPCRVSINTPFRIGGRMFATDGRIGIIAGGTSLSDDFKDNQAHIAECLLKMESEAKHGIATEELLPFDLGLLDKAAEAVYTAVAPRIKDLKQSIADIDELDYDEVLTDNDVYRLFTAVILDTPLHIHISGYYAALVADLNATFGPIQAFYNKDNPNKLLFFEGKGFNAIQMPLRANIDPLDYRHTGIEAVALAATGKLIYDRNWTK